MERALRMRAWQKVRVLRSVWHLPNCSQEFREAMVGQIVRYLSNLDPESWNSLVPMIVEIGFHQRRGVVNRLNTVYKKKLRLWNNAEKLLLSGQGLVMHNLMKTTTFISWISHIHKGRISISYHPARSRLGGLQDSQPDPAKVTKNLQALKLIEMHLRHEMPTVLPRLSPKILRFLGRIQHTPLQPPKSFPMLELAFVFSEVNRLFRAIGLLLHPTIHGPYLLELTDPMGRLVVEWDENWALYPPYRRARHKHFVHQKHLHLQAEGWQVLCLSLADFKTKDTKEEKLAFLQQFVKENNLDYLLHHQQKENEQDRVIRTNSVGVNVRRA